MFTLPGTTEIYRQIKQYFDEEDFADINLVNLTWILFEHKFSHLDIDQLLFKLHRFQATLKASKISMQYIYQKAHKLSNQGYTNNLAASFWQKAVEKYPDIELFRDPDKDEEEIRQMIEKTRQFIEQHLSKLRGEF